MWRRRCCPARLCLTQDEASQIAQAVKGIALVWSKRTGATSMGAVMAVSTTSSASPVTRTRAVPDSRGAGLADRMARGVEEAAVLGDNSQSAARRWKA